MKSIIMGHRGSREHFLENTLKSFEALKLTKAKAVEFDIHYTSDGHWIVHHDDTFERLTNSKMFIAQISLNDLESINHTDGQKIPTLDEVLQVYSGTDFEMQIEIKSNGNFKNLIDQCRKNSDLKKITFISFNHKILKQLKNLNSDIKTTCLLYGLPVNALDIIHSAQSDGISLNVHLVDAELVKQCQSNHFKVTVWNANDRETFLRMKNLGVDIIATDKTIEVFNWIED